MDILDLALRVKRGVKLLDRRVPRWRQVLRRHEDQFDLADSEHCVLGTLEHRVGRLRVAAGKVAKRDDTAYFRMARLFGLAKRKQGAEYGFDIREIDDSIDGESAEQGEYAALSDLWRAEFRAEKR